MNADRGVLALAGIFGLGFALLVGAFLFSEAERSCADTAFRPFPPNRLSGPVRMLPEFVR